MTSTHCSSSEDNLLALFNECFELRDGARIAASKLCTIMKLKGYEKPENRLYVWLDAHFADHEFVRSSCARSDRATCARGLASGLASRLSTAVRRVRRGLHRASTYM